MKTSKFSAVASTLTVVTITMVAGLFCHKEFYLNHIKIVSTVETNNYSTKAAEYVFTNLIDTTSTLTNTDSPLFENKSVTPPISSIDPVSENIYFHTSAGKTFVSSNNTLIRIPPFAFVDSSGKILNSEIEIQFREFSQPYDIFLSGIPMKYDSISTLSTQCLFEINASLYGKPVSIDPLKPIIVTFSSAPDSKSKLYHYEQTSNKWKPENNFIPEKIQQDNDYKEPIQSLLLPKYAVALKCKTKMELKRENFFGKKHMPDHFIFSIQKFTNLFPELKELQDVNWISTNMNVLYDYYLLFSPGQERIYAENIIYCDSISINTSTDCYVLNIKSKNRNIQLNIKPYIVNTTDELKFRLAYESYLSAREYRFLIESQLVKMFIDSTIIGKQTTTDTSKISEKSHSLKIDQLGIWTCAKKVNITFPIYADAEFVDEAGRKIEVTKGWLALKNQNTIFSYADFCNFGFNPSSKYFFWTVLPGDKIGIVYPEEFRRHINTSGEVKFKMNIYEDSDVLKKKILSLAG